MLPGTGKAVRTRDSGTTFPRAAVMGPDRMRCVSFGPESMDADAIYFAAFEQFGRCLERRLLEDDHLHDDFLATCLRGPSERTGSAGTETFGA